MNKKIIGLIVMIVVVFVIAMRIYSLKVTDKGEKGKSDEVQSAITEITIESATELDEQNTKTSVIQGQQTESGQQEERRVLIVEDEELRNTGVFAAFINKEISAYDDTEKGKRYIYEYFADYGKIYGVHYMLEDLNQDEKRELLIFIEREMGGRGDLLVFEEIESGELIAWEIWKNIMTDRQAYVYYCGNGMFEMYGGLGTSVGRYTQEGTHEILMDWYTRIDEFYDTHYGVSIWLRLYEKGEEITNMEYKCYYDTETDQHIAELEEEEAREGERLAEELMSMLGEGKALPVESDEYKDNVKTVLQKELQNP